MKYLLDLSDLLEDELQHVYRSEKRLLSFLDDLHRSTSVKLSVLCRKRCRDFCSSQFEKY